ncbi:MAG: energy transducer TonB [Acidobacteriota bacterium]|nr:energy transducer TonB [Acidobacteriota bacterium]
MNRRFLSGCLAVAVLASAAFAQAGGQAWGWVAPEEEEFAVRMPAAPLRALRVLPFGGDSKRRPRVYEAAGGGVRYWVLSFEKSGAPARSAGTLDEVINGLRHALRGTATGDYAIAHERDLTLDGRAGKQFILRSDKPVGTVRAYEAARHIYVLMTLGGRAGEPEVDRFFSSFTLDPQSQDTAQALKRVRQPLPEEVPDSLWPFLLEAKSMGVVLGDRGGAPAPSGRGKVVQGGVINGKVVKRVDPVYPPIAKAARASGMVVVQITVDEEGRVVEASAVTGHPLPQQAAVDAVRQWRFAPVRLEGQPVRVVGTVSVGFSLR